MIQSRSQVIDFTHQFWAELIRLLIPYPQKDDDLGGITLPFRYEVFHTINFKFIERIAEKKTLLFS